jgi:hypothetical protein
VNARHSGWLGVSLLVVTACGGDAFESNPRTVSDAGADVKLDAPSHVGGSGGKPKVDAATGGAGGASGSVAIGGASGAAGVAGVAGTAGAPPDDAGVDACDSVTLFQDGDGDGFGSTTTGTGCEGTPGWVAEGGDCDDSNSAVHPGQTSYFVDGYTRTGSTELSFDYDCNGNESEAGTNAKAYCHLMNLQCIGGGYIPATPLRSGPGVDPYCGSDEKLACVGNSLKCDPGGTYGAATIACR